MSTAVHRIHNFSAGPAAILRHDVLAQRIGQPLPDNAGGEIRRSARRHRDDEAYRSHRV